jgi:hypothetical protein
MMARQASQQHDRYDFGYPMLTRYAEAELTVSKATDWFPVEDELQDVTLIDGEAYRGVEKMESYALGMVGVTVFNKDPDEQLEVFRPQVANRV